MARGAENSLSQLRQANLELVLANLVQQGPAPQALLAKRTGLSASSISNLIKILKEQGQVETIPTVYSGRSALEVRLLAKPGRILGIHLDEHRTAISLLDHSPAVIWERCVNRLPEESQSDYIQRCSEEIHQLLAFDQITFKDLSGIGVAIPAPVDENRIQVLAQDFFQGWELDQAIDQLTSQFGCPVGLENDATAAAISYRFFMPPSLGDSYVGIIVDKGIGAGLYLKGRIFTGYQGIAGEIGHVLVNEGKEICRCGNTGCLETEASVDAVLRRAQRIGQDFDSLIELLERIESGNLAVRRLVEDAGRTLGWALVSLVNILNPKNIILSGSELAVHPLYVNAARDILERSVAISEEKRTKIQAASDWKYVSARGAAITSVPELHLRFVGSM